MRKCQHFSPIPTVFSKAVFLKVVYIWECVVKSLQHSYDFHIFKGGYLDFSHLTEFEKIYITVIYIKKM